MLQAIKHPTASLHMAYSSLVRFPKQAGAGRHSDEPMLQLVDHVQMNVTGNALPTRHSKSL